MFVVPINILGGFYLLPADTEAKVTLGKRRELYYESSVAIHETEYPNWVEDITDAIRKHEAVSI